MLLRVIDFMLENQLSLSCAESCTGGLLSAKFVSCPGISKIFREGIVTYTNESKMKRLGVTADVLEKFGAVSKQVALEMLRGLETDIGISITGLAGPNSDDFKNPVGLVYIGLKIKNAIHVRKYNFTGGRDEIRNQAVDSALKFLEEKLLGDVDEKSCSAEKIH